MKDPCPNRKYTTEILKIINIKNIFHISFHSFLSVHDCDYVNNTLSPVISIQLGTFKINS